MSSFSFSEFTLDTCQILCMRWCTGWEKEKRPKWSNFIKVIGLLTLATNSGVSINIPVLQKEKYIWYSIQLKKIHNIKVSFYSSTWIEWFSLNDFEHLTTIICIMHHNIKKLLLLFLFLTWKNPDNPGFSSVVQLALSVCEALDSNPSTKKKRAENSEAKMFEYLETWIVYPRLSEQ